MVVQWLRTWLFDVEVRSSSPHTCNLGSLGYLADLIRYARLQSLLDHLMYGPWPSLSGLVYLGHKVHK